VPHIDILLVLIQSSPAIVGGFLRRRFVKAGGDWGGASLYVANPSPVILKKQHKKLRRSIWEGHEFVRIRYFKDT
jgi:hypothetical protein